MSYIVPREMPLRCFECGYISSSTMDGYSCKIAHKSLASEHGINVRRPDWCPLVEVKTPHSELIDKDKLMQEIMDSDLDHLQRDDWKEVIQIVSDADVVIEAERKEG